MLEDRGHRPPFELVLLEANFVGFGGSGRNAGMVLHEAHFDRAKKLGSEAVRFTYDQTVGAVKRLMVSHNISCVPVANANDEAIGMVTSTDLIDHQSETTAITEIMSTKVYTVPLYSDPSLAARIMRNHHIHHVVVTHEKRIVGIISSFDLLRLVEDHRFVAKNAPTVPKKAGGKRMREEQR